MHLHIDYFHSPCDGVLSKRNNLTFTEAQDSHKKDGACAGGPFTRLPTHIGVFSRLSEMTLREEGVVSPSENNQEINYVWLDVRSSVRPNVADGWKEAFPKT